MSDRTTGNRSTRDRTARGRRLGRTAIAGLVAVLLSLVGLVGAPTAAQAKPTGGASEAAIKAARNAEPSALSGAVTGTLEDGTGKVDGIFNVSKFVVEGGDLMAVGKFIGTIIDSTGKVHVGSKKLTLPVKTQKAGSDAKSVQQSTERLAPQAAAAAPLSCQLLDLVLGPLDLDLLGLTVHLDTVHLNITAQGGPGNLLGNLLCAVAGLLDSGSGLNGILNQLASILNKLLGVLG